MKDKDRLLREKERLAHIWQTLAPEQREMRKQTERLNTLTKELEAYRSDILTLEEACKRAGYYTDSTSANTRAMFENAMTRESVLIETCKVENLIKDSLDVTEKLLEKEKKILHKELERVRMEKFWNIADGFRRRNNSLSPIESLWLVEENKIDEDVLKVRDLRQLCWQRMHVDAQKLDNLRAWERQRQERQAQEEQRQRERQERHDRQARERERQRREYSDSQQQRDYRRGRTSSQGYRTDGGGRSRPPFDRKPPYPYARPEGKREKTIPEDVSIPKAWAAYQNRWAKMNQAVTFDSPLTYASIPWPVIDESNHSSSLTPERMAHFLLSSYHSPDKPAMLRIREAMRLWHPDKFEGRFMSSVAVTDRAVVREGLGMVARGLIELMRVQKKLEG